MTFEKIFIYIFVICFGILVGTGMSFIFAFLSRLERSRFSGLSRHFSKCPRLVRYLWILILPTVFGTFSFALPCKFVYKVLSARCGVAGSSSISILYSCSFLISFGVTTLVLVKLGKMKISLKWPSD